MRDYFKYCDAFIILTRQGVVLTSDDTHITLEEDRYLNNLNQLLMKRKKENRPPGSANFPEASTAGIATNQEPIT